MRLLDPDEFLAWATGRGIDVPASGRLAFQGIRNYSRFWVMPEYMGGYPHFVAMMLDGLGPWESCIAWFPHGRWPGREWGVLDSPVDDVWVAILRALAIPDQFTGAVEFRRGERGQLLAVAFHQMIFGGNVSDDIHLIPDHGRAFLMVSHHEVIHATFRRPGLVKPFVEHMEKKGHPLPTLPPDATFYKPRWMKTPPPADQAG